MAVIIDGTNGVNSSGSFYGQSTYTGSYTDGIVVDYTTGTGRITVGSADGLKIRNGGTGSPVDLVTVDSSGNVGIGTSSPSYRLQVKAATNQNFTVGGAVNIANSVSLAAVNDANNANIPVEMRFATNFAWIDSGIERMRIDASGNLLVGTTITNPVAARVNGTVVQASGGVYTRSASSQSYFGLNATSGTNITFYTDNGSSFVAAGTISSSGSVTAYNVTSDYRLKQNVQPMTNTLSLISQLKPCTYEYIEGNQYSEGFIAHELQEVVPHAVTGEKDAVDADGNPVYQGVDASFLIPHLVAALQEQQVQISSQATELSSQAAVIASLIARIEALEVK